MRRIYIIGPVGSGKTTLARKLSKKYNIRMYELDKVVWDDDNGNVKRSVDDINRLFSDIIKNDSWIIEDVGRKYFIDGIKNADMVYYIKINLFVLYKRVIVRWIRQLCGRESYNYKPTIGGLIQMLKWATNDVLRRKKRLKYISDNTNNLKCINSKKFDDIF